MKLKELREKREEIINKYKSDMTVEELQKEYSATWGDIYNVISPCLRHKKCNISDFEKYKIIKMYTVDRKSSTKIGVQLNIHHKLVNQILREAGIEKDNSIKRKYSLNEHYFDVIDTPNKAYILGLFYADGYNSMNKSTIRLELQETDRSILEKIRLEVESEKPLKFIQCDNKVAKNGFISKNMYQLEFYSTHICKCLDKWGMHQNKSLILEFPKFLNEELYSHFFRGYFDGDGSFCRGKGATWHNFVITLTSTDAFCNDALEFLHSHGIIPGGGIYDASCRNGVTKVLSISGRHQTKAFLDWIYKDADLFIERKNDLYLKNFAA